MAAMMEVPPRCGNSRGRAHHLWKGDEMAKRICAVESCERLAVRRGWCQMHERRWKVSGDPLGTADKRPRRSTMKSGYIRIWEPDHPLAGRDHYVLEHRKVWFDANGPIPKGSHVHHLNGDKTDNRLENLEVLAASDHVAQHVQEAGYVVNQFGTWTLRSRR